MKKKINRLLFIVFFVMSLVLLSEKAVAAPPREFYQLTVYHYTTTVQEQSLDTYLQQALLPALHRLKIKSVGVFKAIANDTAAVKKLYVLIPLKSLNAVTDMAVKLSSDKEYQSKADAYLNAVYNAAPYSRMETILLHAFSLAPVMQLPQLKSPKNERVYELRSYESATEKIFKNKVHMFNEGDEVGLFKRLNFNAIFYAEVVAGSKMPNLMYMTSFENMADRDAHWKSFGSDPAWKKLSAMPEYKNNVSHIDIMFLRPTEYSDY
ncbi:NIPSNAP family protein [Lacibacter sp. H375]|uniref:NIPSNAP family protein n=1 Tax=Lacibacter sp. H375 TaxID=3133424 RepID=UPI0030C34001